MYRILFWVASLLYGAIIAVRNVLYACCLLPSRSVRVPAVCVGNITAGGTGKTPLVIWVCRYLSAKGLSCAILTRGYKTADGQMTDEPALLTKACGDVPVIINSDRLAGGRKAIEKYKCQVLILDDGFQHRRMKRDLDIVAVDATCPFGYGRIIPAGLLRESPRSLKRASAVVITRADQVAPEQLQAVEQKIQALSPEIPVAKTMHRQTCAVTLDNKQIDLKEFDGKWIYAFCGIGNPTAFFDSLKQHRMEVAGTKIFDDHHTYTAEDMEVIFERAGQCDAEVIVCTRKDWVKSALLAPKKEGFVFAYLAMELDFIEGFDTMKQLLDDLVETKIMTGKESA